MMAGLGTLTHMFAELYLLQDLGIPLKGSSRIRYTCMSVSRRYIALGCNTGGVYVFGRDSLKHLHSIYADVDSCPVLVVALSPNELNVGFAVSSGQVVVMEMNIERRSKAERLRQTSDHLGAIVTTMVWDATSSSLFVGDCTGKITHVNVPTSKAHIFRQPSQTIVRLDSGVTQMDWWGGKLLASSLTRTYLLNTAKQQFSQIGKKPREGEFGACFYLEPSSKYPVIYCARPGSRMWEVDFEGNVLNTHQFKQLLATPPLPIITPGVDLEAALQAPNPGPQSVNFVQMLTLGEFILAWGSRGLYVFDPSNVKVVVWTDTVRGIKDVCILKNEVYIFFDDQKVRRLVFLPILLLCSALVTRQRCVMAADLLLFVEQCAASPKVLKCVKKELLPQLLMLLKEASRQDLADRLQAMLEDISESSQDSVILQENADFSMKLDGAASTHLFSQRSGGIVVVNDGVLTFGHPDRLQSPSHFSPVVMGQRRGEVRMSPESSVAHSSEKSATPPQNSDGKLDQSPHATEQTHHWLKDKEIDQSEQPVHSVDSNRPLVSARVVDISSDKVSIKPGDLFELSTFEAFDASDAGSYTDVSSAEEPGGFCWKERDEGDGEREDRIVRDRMECEEDRDIQDQDRMHREEGGRRKTDRGKEDGEDRDRSKGEADRGETDRKDRGETDRKDRGETDRKDRGETDRRDRGETHRKDRGETDRGETDRRDRGETDRGEMERGKEGSTTFPHSEVCQPELSIENRHLLLTAHATNRRGEGEDDAVTSSTSTHINLRGPAHTATHMDCVSEDRLTEDTPPLAQASAEGQRDCNSHNGPWAQPCSAQLRKVSSMPDMGGEKGGGVTAEQEGSNGWGEGPVTPPHPTNDTMPNSDPLERIAETVRRKRRRRPQEMDIPVTSTTSEPQQPRRESSSAIPDHTAQTTPVNITMAAAHSLEQTDKDTVIIGDGLALTSATSIAPATSVTPSDGLGQSWSSSKDVGTEGEQGEEVTTVHDFYPSSDVDDSPTCATSALEKSGTGEITGGCAISIPGHRDWNHQPAVIQNHTEMGKRQDSNSDNTPTGERTPSDSSPHDRLPLRRSSYENEVIPPLIERLSAFGVAPATVCSEEGGGESHDLSLVKALITEASKQKIASVRERMTKLGTSTRSLIRRVKEKKPLVSCSTSSSPPLLNGSASTFPWTREDGSDVSGIVYPSDESDSATTFAPLSQTSQSASVADLLSLTSDTLTQLGRQSTLLEPGSLKRLLNAWAVQLHTTMFDHYMKRHTAMSDKGQASVARPHSITSTTMPLPIQKEAQEMSEKVLGEGGGGMVIGVQTREIIADADSEASHVPVVTYFGLPVEERNGSVHRLAETDCVSLKRLEHEQREESGGGSVVGVEEGCASKGHEQAVILKGGGVFPSENVSHTQDNGRAMSPPSHTLHNGWKAGQYMSDSSDSTITPFRIPTPPASLPIIHPLTCTPIVSQAEDVSLAQVVNNEFRMEEDDSIQASETSQVDQTFSPKVEEPLIDWKAVVHVKDPFELSPQQHMAVSTLALYCLECSCFGNAASFFGLDSVQPERTGVDNASKTHPSQDKVLRTDRPCNQHAIPDLCQQKIESGSGEMKPSGELVHDSICPSTNNQNQKGKEDLPIDRSDGLNWATAEGLGSVESFGKSLAECVAGGDGDAADDEERALFVRLYYPFLPHWRLRQVVVEGEVSTWHRTWLALVLCCQALGVGDAVYMKAMAGDVRGALDCLRSGVMTNRLALLGHLASLFTQSAQLVTDFLTECPRQVKLADLLHLCKLHSTPVIQLLPRYLALCLGATPLPARLELLRAMCTCSEVTLAVLSCLLHLRSYLLSHSTSPDVWVVGGEMGWRGGVDANRPSLRWVEDMLEGVVPLLKAGHQEAALKACCEHSYWSGYMRLLKQSNQWEKALQVVVKLNDINLLNGCIAYGYAPRNTEEWEYLLLLYQHASVPSQRSREQSCSVQYGKDDHRSDTAEGRALSWLSLGQLAAQHLGTCSAVQLLQACCRREDQGEVAISPDLYTTYLAMSALRSQQQLVIHNMLEKVDSYLWAKKPVHLPPQVHYAVMQEKTAVQNGSTDDHNYHNLFSRLSGGSVSDSPLAEDPDCHWGVHTNIHKQCAVCRVEAVETVSHVEPGIYTFRCGHIFHKFCVPDKECPLC